MECNSLSLYIYSNCMEQYLVCAWPLHLHSREMTIGQDSSYTNLLFHAGMTSCLACQAKGDSISPLAAIALSCHKCFPVKLLSQCLNGVLAESVPLCQIGPPVSAANFSGKHTQQDHKTGKASEL